ncbi:hypothetical protein DRJ17_05700 [Candidatus Woesearchaeota archaeon]|nr:MAG: hypothetical protein DRJ17_05700 [Candidatus Woesearchaeota archaeon]
METKNTTQQKHKGQIMFDLATAVVAIALILYFGLYIITEINNTNERTLEEQILFNRVVSAADYLVKTGAVETQQRFGKTAIYHHKIIESEVYAKETELETKLKLDLIFEICDSVSDCSEKDGCLCVNRIVLLGDEVKNLQVCGK